MKRALFSACDARGIVEFAMPLTAWGWSIIATGETVKALAEAGVKSEDSRDFVQEHRDYPFPPTLHPKMESALTQDVPYRIDLVYDVPYPPSEGNDVGGRTLLALAAKGGRIVAYTSEDMRLVVDGLRADKAHESIPSKLRQELIDKANAHVAGHYMNLARRGEYDGLIGKSVLKLASGENPYQVPAHLYAVDGVDDLALSRFKSLTNSVPCYTNLADTDSVLHAMCLAAEAFRLNRNGVPYIAAAAKHGNPCGMVVDWNSPANAVEKALWGNPMAVWGGEFMANFRITGELAEGLYEDKRRGERGGSKWMLDVVAAPEFEDEAVEVLGRRPVSKLLTNPALNEPKLPEDELGIRHVRGGFLRQPLQNYVLDLRERKLDNGVVDSLIIAWCVAYSSFHGGNEVSLAKDRHLIGVGGGPSTVEAAQTAVSRARNIGHGTEGSVFCADAFFPFTDAPKLLCEAGCRCGAVPCGGRREAEVRDYFKGAGVEVIYLPADCRGFIRH